LLQEPSVVRILKALEAIVGKGAAQGVRVKEFLHIANVDIPRLNGSTEDDLLLDVRPRVQSGDDILGDHVGRQYLVPDVSQRPDETVHPRLNRTFSC
jgi:hypothetical protein